jgi:hypothetical protein
VRSAARGEILLLLLWSRAYLQRALPLRLTMAAFDVAEVVSLSQKATELDSKSHFERSVEKWRAALAAAKVLGAEDCVLVAAIQSELTRGLMACETFSRGRLSQAFVLELLDLHAVSATILRRRRDTDTLMEGKCRPIEVQWFIDFIAGGMPADAASAAKILAHAELVGYDTFFGACYSSMLLLCQAMVDGSFELGGEAERTFLSFMCDLLDDAVALMVQPRVKESCTAMEFAMFTIWPEMLDALASPEHRMWHRRVSRAQARLHQSGVFEKRGMNRDAAIRAYDRLLEDKARADEEREAAAASGQLRSCAMASCGAKEAHVSHFGKCSACKTAVYCCREHQQADRPAHKAACKAARKAAAAKGAA